MKIFQSLFIFFSLLSLSAFAQGPNTNLSLRFSFGGSQIQLSNEKAEIYALAGSITNATVILSNQGSQNLDFTASPVVSDSSAIQLSDPAGIPHQLTQGESYSWQLSYQPAAVQSDTLDFVLYPSNAIAPVTNTITGYGYSPLSLPFGQLREKAEFSNTYGQTLASFQGRLIRVGGPFAQSNQVWESFDDGLSWNLQPGTLSFEWDKDLQVLTDSNALYVWAADGTFYRTLDGTNWEARGSWTSARADSKLLEKDGTFFIIGGYEDVPNDQIIVSSNQAASWASIGTNLPYTAYQHSATVARGKIWINGGGGSLGNRVLSSTNGIDWTQEGMTTSTYYKASMIHYHNAFYIFRGSDVYTSLDGDNWSYYYDNYTSDIDVDGDAIVKHKDELYLVGNYSYGDGSAEIFTTAELPNRSKFSVYSAYSIPGYIEDQNNITPDETIQFELFSSDENQALIDPSDKSFSGIFVSNAGQASLDISDITLSGGLETVLSSSFSTENLSPGEKINFGFTVLSNSTGHFMGDVIISNNDLDYSDFSFSLDLKLLGPTHHFSFDDNINDSLTGSSLSVQSNENYTNDRMGNNASAYQFRHGAQGNVLNLSNNSQISNMSENYSFSFWVKPSTNENYPKVILTKGFQYDMNLQFRLLIDANTNYIFEYFNGDFEEGYTIGEAKIDTWQHVAWTMENLNTVFYLNGIETGAPYLNNLPDGSQAITLGADSGEGNYNKFFHGAIDDFKIFNYSLDQIEIYQQNLNSGPSAYFSLGYDPVIEGEKETETISLDAKNQIAVPLEVYNLGDSPLHFSNNTPFTLSGDVFEDGNAVLMNMETLNELLPGEKTTALVRVTSFPGTRKSLFVSVHSDDPSMSKRTGELEVIHEGLHSHFPLNNSLSNSVGNLQLSSLNPVVYGSDAYGNTSGAMLFDPDDSTRDVLTVENSSNIIFNELESWAISLNFQANELNQEQILFHESDTEQELSWQMIISSNSNLVFRYRSNASVWDEEHSIPGTLSNGGWYHLISSFDSSTMYFYVNGGSQGSHSIPFDSQLFSASANLEFGGMVSDNAFDFKGSMSDIRLHLNSLNPLDIKKYSDAALWNLIANEQEFAYDENIGNIESYLNDYITIQLNPVEIGESSQTALHFYNSGKMPLSNTSITIEHIGHDNISLSDTETGVINGPGSNTVYLQFNPSSNATYQSHLILSNSIFDEQVVFRVIARPQGQLAHYDFNNNLSNSRGILGAITPFGPPGGGQLPENSIVPDQVTMEPPEMNETNYLVSTAEDNQAIDMSELDSPLIIDQSVLGGLTEFTFQIVISNNPPEFGDYNNFYFSVFEQEYFSEDNPLLPPVNDFRLGLRGDENEKLMFTSSVNYINLTPVFGEWTTYTIRLKDEQLELFRDAEFVESVENFKPIRSGGVLKIGSSGDMFSSPLFAAIDDIKIYNYALADNELSQLMGAQIASSESEQKLSLSPSDWQMRSIVASNFHGNSRFLEDNSDVSWYIWNEDLEEDAHFLKYQNAISISAGTAYWLFHPESKDLDLSGEAPAEDISIELKRGWNMVGNPYNGRYSIDSVISGIVETSVDTNAIYTYAKSGLGYQYIPQQSGDELGLGEAIWLYAYSNGSLEFNSSSASALEVEADQTLPSGSYAAETDPDSGNFYLPLVLRVNNQVDGYNRVGFQKESARSLAAPRGPQANSLDIVQSGVNYSSVATDEFSGFQAWPIKLEVRSPRADVELSVPGASALRQMGLYLAIRDTKNGRVHSLQQNESLGFESDSVGAAYHFELLIFNEDYEFLLNNEIILSHKIYPMPLQNGESASLELASARSGHYNLLVYDYSGRTVFRNEGEVAESSLSEDGFLVTHEWEVPENLPYGVYLYELYFHSDSGENARVDGQLIYQP